MNKWIINTLLFIFIISLNIPGLLSNVQAKENILYFWHAWPEPNFPRNIFIVEKIQEFEKSHPGFKIEQFGYTDEPFKIKLKTEMIAGKAPDIFFTWPAQFLEQFVPSGKVFNLTEDLEEEGWIENFYDFAIENCKFIENGIEGIYAIPIAVQVIVVYYNRELFQEHNLSIPETFDELLKTCRELSSLGITPFAMGNLQKYPGMFFFNYLLDRIGGTRIFEDAIFQMNGVLFTDPPFIEASRKLIELYKAGAFLRGFNGSDLDAARARFLRGRAGMYLMGSWEISRLETLAPKEFIEKLDVFPFPIVKGGKGDQSSVMGVIDLLAVSAQSKFKKDAIDYLKIFTSPEAAEYWVSFTKNISPVKNSLTEENAGRLLYKIDRILQESTNFFIVNDHRTPPEFLDTFMSTLQGLINDDLSPEEAMRILAREAERFLRRRNKS